MVTTSTLSVQSHLGATRFDTGTSILLVFRSAKATALIIDLFYGFYDSLLLKYSRHSAAFCEHSWSKSVIFLLSNTTAIERILTKFLDEYEKKDVVATK